MTSIGSNAVTGLTNSQQRVAKSAEKIVAAGADENSDISVEGELVNIAQASNDFSASATLLKIEKQLSQKLLDILA